MSSTKLFLENFNELLVKKSILPFFREYCKSFKNSKKFEVIVNDISSIFINMYEIQNKIQNEDISKELKEFVNSKFFTFYLYGKLNYFDYIDSLLKKLSEE